MCGCTMAVPTRDRADWTVQTVGELSETERAGVSSHEPRRSTVSSSRGKCRAGLSSLGHNWSLAGRTELTGPRGPSCSHLGSEACCVHCQR